MASPIYDSLRAAIRKGEGQFVSAEEVISALGPRAFGLSVMIVMAPVCLPMPPGVPTIAGVILAMFAMQLMLGYKTPWLPGWIKRRTIARAKLLGGIDTLERRLKWVEKIAHPRLQFLTQGIGARLIGAVFLILGAILILPIPFLGNLPPAIAASILALALAQRDGLLALAGFAASVGAVWFTMKMASVTAGWLGGMLG
ncbi:MAG: exopolysaccharide biosynthesis protein [Parvularculaceae bacterium]